MCILLLTTLEPSWRWIWRWQMRCSIREPDVPFADVTDYFPAPLLALRTLKSDAVVGLKTGLEEQLDKEDARWRVNGKRGVIQFKKKKSDLNRQDAKYAKINAESFSH